MRLAIVRWLCRSLRNDLTRYVDDEHDYSAWLVPDREAA